MTEEHHSFKRLHTLDKDIVASVDRMLLSGESPSKVAAWLQDEVKVLTDIKLDSLKKNLERYRASDLKNKVINDLTEAAKGKSVVAIHKQLSALDELEKLCTLQIGRMNAVITKESQSISAGVVLKYVSDEIKLTKDLLVELGKLQLETGFLSRAPRKVSGQVLDPTTGEMKQFSWTEEQEKIYKQLDDIQYVDTTQDPAAIPDARQ